MTGESLMYYRIAWFCNLCGSLSANCQPALPTADLMLGSDGKFCAMRYGEARPNGKHRNNRRIVRRLSHIIIHRKEH